jgi:hypothetical protein
MTGSAGRQDAANTKVYWKTPKYGLKRLNVNK